MDMLDANNLLTAVTRASMDLELGDISPHHDLDAQPLALGPLRFLVISHCAGIAQTKPFAYRFALAPENAN
jgi:hypothetical protein